MHLTGSEWEVDGLAAFAERRGAKFSHIVLDGGGATPIQPMLTVTGSGTLAELHELAARWRVDLEAADLHVLRVKIEAAPWNEGVPVSDEEARDDLYFEHHVKVLLPAGNHRAWRALSSTAEPHGARPSRNARRKRDDGQEERFVTQRCHGFEVLEVEEEYVVHDDALHVDRGWLEHDPAADFDVARENRMRAAPAGAKGFPFDVPAARGAATAGHPAAGRVRPGGQTLRQRLPGR